jgi:hypothetical protein
MHKAKLLAVVLVALLGALAFLTTLETRADDEVFDTQCGAITEGRFDGPYRNHFYRLNLNEGDTLSVHVESVNNSNNLGIVVRSEHRRQRVKGDSGNSGSTEDVAPFQVPDTGEYRIEVYNEETGGEYRLFVYCSPGPNSMPAVTATPVLAAAPPQPGFSLPNFASAFQIPISLGQAYNAAVTNVAQYTLAYTYQAEANTTAVLTLRRTSGNASLGLEVMNATDNSVIFLAGMPATDSLLAELNFPTAGTYLFGIYRLDIAPNAVGTQGSFELRLDESAFG